MGNKLFIGLMIYKGIIKDFIEKWMKKERKN